MIRFSNPYQKKKKKWEPDFNLLERNRKFLSLFHTHCLIIEDRKGHLTVSWSRYLDKQMSKYQYGFWSFKYFLHADSRNKVTNRVGFTSRVQAELWETFRAEFGPKIRSLILIVQFQVASEFCALRQTLIVLEVMNLHCLVYKHLCSMLYF